MHQVPVVKREDYVMPDGTLVRWLYEGGRCVGWQYVFVGPLQLTCLHQYPSVCQWCLS